MLTNGGSRHLCPVGVGAHGVGVQLGLHRPSHCHLYAITEMAPYHPYHAEQSWQSPLASDPTDGPLLVLAVDDTSSGEHAAIYAAGLARRNPARLAYFYVRRPLPAVLWFEALGGPLEVGPRTAMRSRRWTTSLR